MVSSGQASSRRPRIGSQACGSAFLRNPLNFDATLVRGSRGPGRLRCSDIARAPRRSDARTPRSALWRLRGRPACSAPAVAAARGASRVGGERVRDRSGIPGGRAQRGRGDGAESPTPGRQAGGDANERMRRQWPASEARAYGWGGVRAVSGAIGMSPNTIRRGLAEL
jgi:hypothetical protein